MKTRTLLLLLAFTIGSMTGCGNSEPESSQTGAPDQQPGSRGTIGLSVLTMTNPFFQDISQSMTEEAAKHGYDVIITSGEFDVAKQQNQVKDFIVQGVSAIVLTPCDSKAIGPAIREANLAGIPVFTADIACLAPDAQVVCHIATDNAQGGRLAGQAMVEALGGKGEVAIIDHPEVESVIQRTTGFEAAIAEANQQPGVDIQIVAKLPGGGVKDRSFRVMQDLLQAHPGLDGVFAINDHTAMGALAALETADKVGQVQIVGFDGQPDARQAIREGKIYADPIQFPKQIGRKTVQAVVSYFQGEAVPEEILIPTRLYTKADAIAEQDVPAP